MVVNASRPVQFDPEAVPDGAYTSFVSFWADRPKIKPRLQHVHTNGASREGSIRASKNWAEMRPGSNTLPHYQIDRDGSAAKLLPTDRKGIGSTTVSSARGSHGNVADWTLVYETADTGTIDDPGISAFTDDQLEAVAVVCAFESIVAGNGVDMGIPLTYPSEWWGAGTATHTEPFGYPYTTLYDGKICPGDKKKRQVRELVLPRAREIVKSWLGPVVVPTKPPDGTLLAHGWYQVRAGDGPWAIAARVLGNGRRHPELSARNPGMWKPGQFIEIPDEPSVVVTVRAGEGWYSVLRRALPGENPGSRIGAAVEWNGGPNRMLRPNDVVSVPVRWKP